MSTNEKPEMKRGPKSNNRANGERTKNDELIKDYGNLLRDELTEEERANLLSRSGTLHFINILGLDSRHGSNTERGVRGYDEKTGKANREGTKNAMLSIGVKLVSQVDIVVPRIGTKINKRLLLRGKDKNLLELEFVKELMNIDYENVEYDETKDVSFERIEAGENIILSNYEAMFLLLRPEYGAILALGDDPKGAQLKLRFDNCIIRKQDGTPDLVVTEGKVKLPSPSVISFNKTSLKRRGIPVDRRIADGTYEIKPEYKRFADLVSRTGSMRGNKRLENQEIREAKKAQAMDESLNTQSKILLDAPDPTLRSLALQEFILFNNKKYTKTNEALLVEGKRILNTINKDRRNKLGYKSDTLQVMDSLYFGERPIGLTLKSDIDIEVPSIPVTSAYRKRGYVDNVEVADISNKMVTAGEEFVLTMNEFTLLIIRDEYAGFCAVNGTSKGCSFSPRLVELERYIRLIPRVDFSKEVTVFSNYAISIDPMTIKPKYLPKFQDLI